MDTIRNEYTRGSAQVGRFGEKTREARLRWYGHTCTEEKLMGILGDGYWKAKMRFMDVMKGDMAEVEVTEEDTEGRKNWRCIIHRSGNP